MKDLANTSFPELPQPAQLFSCTSPSLCATDEISKKPALRGPQFLDGRDILHQQGCRSSPLGSFFSECATRPRRMPLIRKIGQKSALQGTRSDATRYSGCLPFRNDSLLRRLSAVLPYLRLVEASA